MEIVYFTNAQREYVLPFFADYVFTNPYWNFVKTPTGWLLPASVLQDIKTLEQVPNYEEFINTLVIRQYENSDKYTPPIL